MSSLHAREAQRPELRYRNPARADDKQVKITVKAPKEEKQKKTDDRKFTHSSGVTPMRKSFS